MSDVVANPPAGGGPVSALPRVPTGIHGLDSVLQGGLPEGRSFLVTGGAGSGKTVLLNEFLYRGATDLDAPGVFITFEETAADIRRNCETFGWDIQGLLDSGRLRLVDLSPDPGEAGVAGAFDLRPTLEIIIHAIRSSGARRVAIDSIGALFARLPDRRAVRGLLFQLGAALKAEGVTTLFSAERPSGSPGLTREGLEEFVLDGVIALETGRGQNRLLRRLEVLKLRGAGFRSGPVQFAIDADGLTVYPKIAADPLAAATDFATRLGFGVAGLDAAMTGGVPQGHMMLVAGNTGTGKTLLGLHFLTEGMQAGETTLWVALEEPVRQVEKTAAAFGWDLEARRADGQLHFVGASLLDIFPDKLLYDIAEAVERTGATRVVFDSVSSLESATMSKEQLREFLIQLAAFCKGRGITVLMNYLATASFGATSDQLLGSLATNELRLSSIVDGILLLRYVERQQAVHKLLTVLKLRGSRHDRSILTYEIEATGITVGERFQV